MVSDKVRSAGFAAVRMRYRYPWRTGGVGAAAAAAGIWLETSGVTDPAWALVPGGVAVAGGATAWWWLRHADTSGRARLRGLRRWPWRSTVLGAGVAGLGIVQHTAGVDPVLVLLPGGLVVTAGASGWWWLAHVARPHSTRAAIGRRAELDQRTAGVATWLDVAERSGPAALRRKAGVLRPTTVAGLGWWARRRMDPRQLGVEIARMGWGLPGQSVWSSVEDTTLRIAPPRAGKTISMACHAWDAPGALITTSTRLDLAEMVHAARTARGAVYFFNPSRMGGVPTTLRWRVLSGCTDFGTAQRRAADLIPPSGVADAERWDADARRILALLLHAAAVSGRGMRAVVRWNSDHGSRTQDEVTAALLAAGEGGRDRVDAMRQHWGTNDRTRTSVTAMLNAPLAWVRDERIRPLADFPDGAPGQVDLTELILRGQTLHLLGRATQTGEAPLIAALVAEIAETARMLAEDRPGGRLDPPLRMVLDEIALICPIPLDAWSADMGGKGVDIHAAVQSLSQLRQRWGTDGAGTILGNIGSLIIFGGSPSAADLRDISALTGEHRMHVVGVDHDRVDDHRDGELRGEYRWVPVLSPAQIRDLDPLQVLVLKRDLHTVVGWAPKIVDRPDWVYTSLRPDPHLLDELDATTDPTAGQVLEGTVAGGTPLGAATGARARLRSVLATLRLPSLRRSRTAPTVPAAPVTGGRAPDTQPIPVQATDADPDGAHPDAPTGVPTDVPLIDLDAARQALARRRHRAPDDTQAGGDGQAGGDAGPDAGSRS
jgi:type IV secretion system protein VirD4